MIRLLFVQGTDFGAEAIQWYGHGAKFSHVESILSDGSVLGSRSDEVGGAPPGVQIRTYGYWGDEKTLQIDLPCSDEITSAYYDFLHSQLGKPYDKVGIAGFIVGRDWQEDDCWFCSELVSAGLVKSGYFNYKPSSSSNKIAPSDLILMLSVIVPIEL